MLKEEKIQDSAGLSVFSEFFFFTDSEVYRKAWHFYSTADKIQKSGRALHIAHKGQRWYVSSHLIPDCVLLFL